MRMRKLLCMGIAVVLVCSNLPQMGVRAQELNAENKVMKMAIGEENERSSNVAAENYQYTELEDGTLKITGYTGSDTELVIPAEIDGKRVTIIGEETFAGGSKFTSITIPEGVTSIGWGAFYGCSSLKSIAIPEGVTNIGDDIFYGCSSLISISIPKSVTSISRSAFFQCSSLMDLRVDVDNVRYSFEDGILYDNKTSVIYCIMSKSGSVSIPEGVTSIGDFAFGSCSSLTSITIPESVTSIGGYAFYVRNRKLVLTVVEGSYAEAYAKQYNIEYSYVGSSESPSCVHIWSTLNTKAAVGKNGAIAKTCNKCGEKTTTTIYAPKVLKLSKTSFTYNNKNQKPFVTVKDSKGKALKNNTDYNVSYPKNMKNVGQYTVTINFKGNYSGTVKKTFTIVPKGTSISKVTPKKKGFKVKWKKQATQTTGYEVAYSTDSKFSKKNTKIVLVGKNNIISKSVPKLKVKKKYYVRIRTYKTVKGKKYYSDWSKVKNVTTKK